MNFEKQEEVFVTTDEKAYKKGMLYQAARKHKQIGYFFLLCVVIFLFVLYLFTPTLISYPKIFTIEQGMSLKQATHLLKDADIVRSATLTNILVTLEAGEGGVVSGTYILKEPNSLGDVVKKITSGDFGLIPKTIRIVEGSTNEEIANFFAAEFKNFNKDAFITYLNENGIEEGFLFPDTYKFLPNANEITVVETLVRTFNEKVRTSEIVASSDLPLRDIVIMASIIEKEADAGSRQEVSNILWKRLSIEMPLQVDASFVYSVNKDTFQLSLEDLQDETNPYNTYVYKGLPPTAISNPSLAALEAAAKPEKTDYLYFLTGSDGTMYYAKDFKTHIRNRRFLE